METRQMTLFFNYFFRCYYLYHSFLNFKIVKIHFHMVPPFVPSGLSVKHLNFWPKATDFDSSSYFSRKKTPEVTKNLYVLFTQWSQISIFRLQLMDYSIFFIFQISIALIIDFFSMYMHIYMRVNRAAYCET